MANIPIIGQNNQDQGKTPLVGQGGQPLKSEEKKKPIEDVLNECDEPTLFLIIDQSNRVLHNMTIWMQQNQDQAKIDLEFREKFAAVQNDSINIAKQHKLAIDTLKSKFGVEPFQTDKDGKQLNAPSDHYHEWMAHWDIWRNELTELEWQQVALLVKEGKKIDKKYLPKHKWNEKDPDVIEKKLPKEFIKDGKLHKSTDFWKWIEGIQTKNKASYRSVIPDEDGQPIAIFRKNK